MRWPPSKRPRLSDPNISADWIERHVWLEWDECPRNLVAGEASYAPALAHIAGEPRGVARCLPVPVTFVREPRNRYDANAFRAEVGGVLVGYLRREVAEQLAGPLDAARCKTFAVAGVIRGGSPQAPNLGCHVWLGRRLTPGPAISFDDDAQVVSWPPRDDELFPASLAS